MEEYDDEFFNKFLRLEQKNDKSNSEKNWNKLNSVNNKTTANKTSNYKQIIRETNKYSKKSYNRIEKDSLCLFLDNVSSTKTKSISYNNWQNELIENNSDSLLFLSSKEKAIHHQFNTLLKLQTQINFLYKPLITKWIHQKEGIKFMMNREKDVDNLNCFGGMQCDEPGMGKTLQMLELIRKTSISLCKKTNNRFNGPTLIVSSSLIIDYWIDFIINNYPKNTFEYIVLSDNNNQNGYLFYDIIFTTYHIIRSSYKYYISMDMNDNNNDDDDDDDNTCKQYTWLFEKPFLRLLCDESDLIINKKTYYFKSIQSINAYHRWYITGTPLRNTLKDTLTALEFIGLYNNNNDDDYNEEELSIKYIKDLLNKVMIRRLKTDKEVFIINKNECNIEINIIEFDSIEEKKIYKIYSNKDLFKKPQDIFACITKLRQSCINTFIIDEPILPKNYFKINFFNDYDKTLRYNKTEKLDLFLEKKYTIPKENLKEYTACLHILNNEYTKTKEEYELLDKNSNSFGYHFLPKFSTKGKFIITYIKNNTLQEEKIVIFYESIKALKQLSYELNEFNISFLLLSGEIKDLKERSLILKRFKNENIKVLLMTKICNQGISLVCANHIIILAPSWTPWNDIQAIHRLHRPGQERNIKVVYFIIKDSIEEYIMKLSFNKLELTNKLFQKSQSSKNDQDFKLKFKFDDFLSMRKNYTDEEVKTNLIKSFIQ